MLKNKLKLIIPILTVLLLTIVGVTYAFFEYYKLGDNNNKMIFGNIYLKLDDGTDTLSLSNVFPETKEEARARTDNLLAFTISGLNTTTDNDIWYQINLVEGEDENDRVRVNPEHLVFDLIEVNSDGTETYLADALSFEDLNSAKIWVDRVNRNTTTEITRTYKLRMWLSEDVFISDTNPIADYSTDIFRNGFASVKVSVYGDFEEKLSPNLNYLLENNFELIEKDSAGTRYLSGNIVNNYLWYSGKLWRIVGVNNDGSVKIVTQGNMTTIAWHTSASINYSSSQIRSWLNNEFLPTLYDSENLLVNHKWDYTTYSSFPTTKSSTSSSVTEKIGLITIYDFMMTGGTESSSTSNSFLENGYYWWTMSPKVSATEIWTCESSNYAAGINPTYSYGVRPVVNLISDIWIDGGDGTKNNPFTLKNDIHVPLANDKLSSRISGEYINFNDGLYRIVGVEKINGVELTKVTMADYSVNRNTLSSTTVAFGASTSQLTLSSTYGIGLYLNNWYNADSTSSTYATNYIKENYKPMIATASTDKIVWYVGSTSGASRNYISAKSGTSISATIGLARYGEMFSSQYGSNNGYTFWTITKYSTSQIWCVNSGGNAGVASPTSKYRVRPYFYLKSNVVIDDVDGDGDVGKGTLNSPYEISIGA